MACFGRSSRFALLSQVWNSPIRLHRPIQRDEAVVIVFVAGMQRSGSTFAFNVARELLRARGRTHQEATPDVAAALERSSDAKHLLLKAHDAGPHTISLARHGAMRTIITVRRIEDAAASWMETFQWSEAETIEYLRAWLKLYVQLRDIALLLPYAQIDHRPWLAAWRIARFLCPDAGLGEVARIARRYAKAEVKKHTDALKSDEDGVTNLGFSYFDEATFFHRRHVSGLRSRPANERIPSEQIARILADLAPDIAAARL